MRRSCAIGLIVLWCGQPMVALAAGPPLEGPLVRSVHREASRLATQPPVDSPPGWEALRGLAPGKRIIAITSTATIAGAFESASDSTLIVRSGDVVQVMSVDDVLLVAASVRRGSGAAAAFGTVGGIWLGSFLALGLVENTRCHTGCAGARLAVWAALIGVPAASGYGSWYQSSRLRDEIIYRRH